MCNNVKHLVNISIHAAREGGDVSCAEYDINSKEFQSTPPVKAATIRGETETANTYISIHAAREGGDYFDCFPHSWLKIFQSTPPVKAATGY